MDQMPNASRLLNLRAFVVKKRTRGGGEDTTVMNVLGIEFALITILIGGFQYDLFTTQPPFMAKSIPIRRSIFKSFFNDF